MRREDMGPHDFVHCVRTALPWLRSYSEGHGQKLQRRREQDMPPQGPEMLPRGWLPHKGVNTL